MNTLTPKPFDRNAPRKRAVKSVASLAAFAKSHTACQCCGLPGRATIHHIIGGRGGRSDEAVNLLYCCWEPCHRDFADHAKNLGVVLSMKLRAGELDDAALARLTQLHGKRLPDLEAIPSYFERLYRINQQRREVA